MSKAIIVLQIQVCVIELEASEAILVSFVNVKLETVYREVLQPPSSVTYSLFLSFLQMIQCHLMNYDNWTMGLEKSRRS